MFVPPPAFVVGLTLAWSFTRFLNWKKNSDAVTDKYLESSQIVLIKFLESHDTKAVTCSTNLVSTVSMCVSVSIAEVLEGLADFLRRFRDWGKGSSAIAAREGA